MKKTSILLALLAFTCGCSAETQNAELNEKKNIIGLWSRPAGDFHEINLKFYPDGKAVLWPVPDVSVEHATYRIEKKEFPLQDGTTVELTMLLHDFKHLVADISPRYMRINFIDSDTLELIRVDSQILELKRVSEDVKMPSKEGVPMQ